MKKIYYANILKNKRLLLFITFIFCSCLISEASYEEISNSVWHEFRAKFPTPLRIIACQENNDGSRVYIISEPPNNLDITCIEELFDGFVHYICTKSTKFGYDGIVKDIVIYTDGIPEFYHEQLIADLYKLIYGTSYKAAYLSLPYNRGRIPMFYDENYNITVNDKCLHDWVFGYNKMFKNVLTSMKVSPTELSEKKNVGVYSSLSDSIIIWCLPTNTDFRNEAENFHIFETESDFLLGALYYNGIVLIVGRKRVCDQVTVPPLRVDEALMLAAAGSTISQSLNITNPVYCKIKGKYDWCPAWVSDNICDSEYAHLLTVTDTYLKFWLHNYDYEIIGYNSCRPPNKFDDSVLNEFNNVRYNWNTNGFTKSTPYNESIVLHFKNIGCLNCNLFDETNNTSLANIEDSAYDFLKNSRSVEIFRVAQYTMLYEIFKSFGITASPNISERKQITPFVSGSFSILSTIKNLKDVEIDSISQKIYERELLQLRSNMSEQEKIQLVKDEDEIINKRQKWDSALLKIANEQANKNNISYEQFTQTNEYFALKQKVNNEIENESLRYFDLTVNLYERSRLLYEIIPKITKTRDRLRNLSPEVFRKLCNYCASPNTYQEKDIDHISKIANTLDCKYILSLYSYYFGIEIEKLLSEYQNNNSVENKWGKNPSVVLINNNDTYFKIGKGFVFYDHTRIGGHSIHNNRTIETRSNISQGERILTLTGNPIGDAYSLSYKAVHSTSTEEKMKYYRKSIEALSQEIKSTKELNKYNRLYEKIERSVYSEIYKPENHENHKREIIDDLNEVKSLVGSELSNNDLSEKKKESYRFIQKVAERDEELLKTKKDEEIEDDEIKELKKRLKRLRMTLAELKKKQ